MRLSVLHLTLKSRKSVEWRGYNDSLVSAGMKMAALGTLIGFIPTRDGDTARAFYEQKVGVVLSRKTSSQSSFNPGKT